MATRLINSLWILTILLMLPGCNLSKNTIGSPIEIITRTPAASAGPNQPTSEGIATGQKTATAAESGPKSAIPDPNAPLALVYLKGQIIHFECLDRKNCIPEVNLEGHILFDSPYHLGRVYYWNPESVYITLLSNSAIPEKMDIIHINPQTREIKSIKSPDEAEFSFIHIAGGRLILARYQGQIVYIVESDLSITEVEVGIDIYKMITDGNKVITLNQIPVEKDGQIYVDVSVVDIVSRQAKPERLKLPGLEVSHDRLTPEANKKYLRFVEGVSGDLKNLYCVFIGGDRPGIARLGTFDVESPKEIASTQGGVAAVGYVQYHGMLYTSYSEKSDGGPGASLYDMSTGHSLIDYNRNPKWIGKKLWIVPFGDYFLLGRSDEIILLSPTGTIVKRYTLPEEWINQDYMIVHFEK